MTARINERLPFEILSYIFFLGLPPMANTSQVYDQPAKFETVATKRWAQYRLKLILVCESWYNVVSQSPHLWAYIGWAESPSMRGRGPYATPVLETTLMKNIQRSFPKSSTAPLILDIHASDVSPAVISLIQQLVGRAGNITITSATTSWQELIGSLFKGDDNLPLHSLTLCGPRRHPSFNFQDQNPPSFPDFGQTTKLRAKLVKLSVREATFNVNSDVIDMSRLLSLSLGNALHPRELEILLSRCQALLYLHTTLADEDYSDIPLNNIQTLELTRPLPTGLIPYRPSATLHFPAAPRISHLKLPRRHLMLGLHPEAETATILTVPCQDIARAPSTWFDREIRDLRLDGSWVGSTFEQTMAMLSSTNHVAPNEEPRSTRIGLVFPHLKILTLEYPPASLLTGWESVNQDEQVQTLSILSKLMSARPELCVRFLFAVNPESPMTSDFVAVERVFLKLEQELHLMFGSRVIVTEQWPADF